MPVAGVAGAAKFATLSIWLAATAARSLAAPVEQKLAVCLLVRSVISVYLYGIQSVVYVV